jgi:hypothetical protein
MAIQMAFPMDARYDQGQIALAQPVQFPHLRFSLTFLLRSSFTLFPIAIKISLR